MLFFLRFLPVSNILYPKNIHHPQNLNEKDCKPHHIFSQIYKTTHISIRSTFSYICFPSNKLNSKKTQQKKNKVYTQSL